MELVDGMQLLKFVASLGFVLALMMGLGIIMRRVNANAGLGLANQKRRLKMVEALSLSPRHRMILVRRDGVEHLVILGPAGETVVETGITPPPEGPAQV